MDLRQLEYFVAVAEEANFTKAAERVHITQSGVSAQIRQFEKELGADLFDRSSRMVRLTAAGAAALPHARQALAAAEAVRRAADEVTGLVRGRLRLGMVTGCTVTPLFVALASFHRAFPRIEVALSEANSDVLMEDVRGGHVDLALVGAAGGLPGDLSSLTIVSEGLVALVPAGHALAARGEVTLRGLCAYPMVCLPPGTGIRGVLDQACAAQGLRPKVALQATAPGAVAGLAARGLGVAVLSASMAGEHPDLTAVPVSGVGLSALLALVWRKEESTVLRALLPHCRRAFGL
ncbi:LysR family transcriptional regulator [Actinoplanes sp. NBRC 14428]|uniref:DNA-binding transcriptional LysR family regulator n=1 Tax=Pseudosporangium ferrugineum TaxID=439699 RepID=A0A2T0RMI8_9ACTN|nr:LysR family transcriptional regulator [Pseudosporangium ferrugineum]PRY22351.1 DNA-binding transcriptional LysR family regulator [Pseudosporangium ferrugineum]BCJ52499.1 LysR family transcriptional regulator [Actinoplanes sp. NBRC 14428]